MAVKKKNADVAGEPQGIPDPETCAELCDTGRFLMVPWLLVRAFCKVAHLISPYEQVMFWFIATKTWGFSKKGKRKLMDWIANKQFYQGTGIPFNKVSETKTKLYRKHMILKDGNKIGIEPNFAKWRIPVTKGTRVGQDLVMKVWREEREDPDGETRGYTCFRPMFLASKKPPYGV